MSFAVERQMKPGDVEIKNGKVIFRQKPMSFEKMTETMQGAWFQTWREAAIDCQQHIPQKWLISGSGWSRGQSAKKIHYLKYPRATGRSLLSLLKRGAHRRLPSDTG